MSASTWAESTDCQCETALAVLQQYDEPLSLADVADEVAVREANAPLTEVDPVSVLDIYMSLYTDCLPRLRAADRVVYDQETDVVALAADRAADAEPEPL